MRVAPSVFVSGSADGVTLLRSLRDAGFQADEPGRVSFTVLDTLDGRLHRRGLRLLAVNADVLTLTLSHAGIAHGALAVAAQPIRASELPGGSMRDAVIAATGERLLLAAAMLIGTRTVASQRDSHNNVKALVTIDDTLHVVGRRKSLASIVTVHRVAGKGTARRRAEAICVDVGFVPAHGDVLGQILESAGVDRPGMSPPPAEVFDNTTNAIDGFRAVLTGLFTAVEGYRLGALDSSDPAFVHGLRVASRRSRSVLVEGKTVLPREALAIANAGMSVLGTCTASARDLDVYLDEWSTYMSLLDGETVAALEPVKAVLEARRRAAYEELSDALRSTAMKTFLRDWGRWLRKPVPRRSLERRADSGRQLVELVAERIERAHLTLLDNGRLITNESPAAQVHDLRRDAKRLRYLLECFGALLPAKATKQFVRRLKSLQDNLGAHQDAEVHATQLTNLVHHDDAQGFSASTVIAMEVFVRQLEHQCRAARAEFTTRFAAYDSPATHTALIGILAAE